jgi:hypothetical protein
LVYLFYFILFLKGELHMKHYTAAMIKAEDDYKAIQSEIITNCKAKLLDAEVTNNNFGSGRITDVYGMSVDLMMITVMFDSIGEKKYAISLALKSGTIRFTNPALNSVYAESMEVYTNATAAHKALMETLEAVAAEEAAAEEARKKDELKAKKAEERYEATKARMLQSFEDMANNNNMVKVNYSDDFFYVLGWLAKHVGTVSAALPDYLAKPFAKYFGADTPCRVVDSKKRGPAGWQSQWSWSFTASLPRAKDIPQMLTTYMNDAQTKISNTSFIWDLVHNYGFKFGKKQDLNSILENVPDCFKTSFDEGYCA